MRWQHHAAEGRAGLPKRSRVRAVLRLVNLEFAKEMRRFTRHETAYNESDQDPIVFSATKIRDDAFLVGFEALSSCVLDTLLGNFNTILAFYGMP